MGNAAHKTKCNLYWISTIKQPILRKVKNTDYRFIYGSILIF